MQVGFSPINFQQRQNKAQNINFGQKIDVKFSVSNPGKLVDRFYGNVHEDSLENRSLLKEVVKGIKKRYGKDARWDIQDIKEAIFEKTNWNQDDELKKILADS